MPAKRAQLALVREAEATGRTREIFAEVRQALGLPQVPLIYKAYAAYPKFLELHWQAFKAALATQEFFDLAERLRAEVYTRMHNYFRVRDLCRTLTEMSFSEGARHELTHLIELLHTANPPCVLIAAAQLEAFDGAVGNERKWREARERPKFEKPVFVEEELARPETKKIYEQIKKQMDLPLVNMDYRALGRWPDFLKNYWEVLRGILASPVYHENQDAIAAAAMELVRELPVQVELTVEQLQNADVSNDNVAALVRMTEKFLYSLSGLSLNIAVAKIGLEGGNIAEADKSAPAA